MLRTGHISLITDGSVISFTCTFEIAMPRKTITIDGETFTLLYNSFQMEMTPTTNPREHIDELYILKSVPDRISRGFEMVIVLPEYTTTTLTTTFSAVGEALDTYSSD